MDGTWMDVDGTWMVHGWYVNCTSDEDGNNDDHDFFETFDINRFIHVVVLSSSTVQGIHS